MRPARSTEIHFATSASSSKSKYEPDALFWHDDAQYPGIIIEVAYSQKKMRLGRLAENYLLDSDASVRTVVGLDIEYGKKGSRKATLSIWRPRLFDTADGPDIPTRLSVTMKETLSTTQAYGSASAISPRKNLHRKFASLGYSSANILLRQRAKYGDRNH